MSPEPSSAHGTASVQKQRRVGSELLLSTSQQPGRDAELLLRHVLRRDRAWLLAHPDAPLTPSQVTEYDALLLRRARHEPVQYILGEQEFYGLRLQVTPAVLIPRPETEHLVEALLGRLPRDRPVYIADIGTGSGAIALALAHELPLAEIDAFDLSEAALKIARGNAEAHGLAERIRFFHSDLLEAAPAGQRYDAIAANPPYVPAGELLEPQVADWEPPEALFAGEDGLLVYRRLLPQAAGHLHRGGYFVGELGMGQAAALETLFRADARWEQPEFVPDLQGIRRVVLARRT